MDNSIKNGALGTVRIYLSPDRNFKLYIVFIHDHKKRYTIDARLEYKDKFISSSYQSTKYLIETIGLFAHRYELDIDCDDFEISQQQKTENQKIRKTLCCKFLKTQVPDKHIYLNRGVCKTIYHIFHDVMHGYNRIWALEEKLHSDVFPSLISQELKSDNISVLNNADRNLQIINNADMPKEVKDIIQEYIKSYENNTDHL